MTARAPLPFLAALILITIAGPAEAFDKARGAPADEFAEEDAELAREQEEAKPKPLKNSVYLEVLGSAIIWSLNYERRIVGPMYVRAGIAPVPSVYGLAGISTLATGATLGTGSHHAEIGGSLAIIVSDLPADMLVGGIVGYRYQVPDHSFVFRATLTPSKYALAPLMPIAFSVGHGW